MMTNDDMIRGGFDFSNYQRNAHLSANGMKGMKTTKTGTTIVGLVYKDGVVLGADTRATEGPIVADKNCEKIHYIAPNIYCCGAGTAADTEYTTSIISSKLELHRLNAGGREVRMVSAMTMLKQYLFGYEGHVGAALILGGIDCTGPSLYTIYPHGSVDRLPFVTMGSGSLAAMAVFEAHWRPNMDKAEAMELVGEAIKAGIFNDLGSGSNVDLTCISTKEAGGVEVFRNWIMPNERPPKEKSYKFARGSTAVLKESIRNVIEIVAEEIQTTAPMDIS